MNNESKKTLIIGMLSGLLFTLQDYFTEYQKEVYENAQKFINEIYYSEDKKNE